MSQSNQPIDDAAHYKKMTETPIPKLVSTLAVPTVLSMLVTSIYSMADTFFVSQLGTSAAGAVGVVFSLMAIIQGVGFMLGQGGGNLVARMLGAQEQQRADAAASLSFFASLLFGIALCCVGEPLLAPFMRLLGSTESILPYSMAYGRYILLAAPVMCASFVMNNLLRGEGKAALAMVGILAGGILNIVLDPIFIFVFDFGIAGAAMATAISQCVSFFLLLLCFLRRKSSVRLRLRGLTKELRLLPAIFSTGLPSLTRQGLASIATVALNVQAAAYGDAAVAAMSIVGRLFMLLFSVLLGFGQGFQPVAGFNYGAKRYDRVRSATLFTMGGGIVIMLCVSALGYAFAPQLIAVFRRDDAAVIAIGSFAARMQCLMLPLAAISTPTNMALQATRHAASATFLSMCRQGVFFFPLVFILPRFFGVYGVALSQPIADVLTMITSVPFLILFLREMRRLDIEQQTLRDAQI